MELTQAIRADLSRAANVSFLRSNDTQESNVKSNYKFAVSDKIDLTHSTQSNFSVNVASSIKQIAQIQAVKNSVDTSLQLVNNFQQLITSNSNSLNDVQPQIQHFINTFNNSSTSLSENMSKIIEEKQSDDSRTYFDGVLGSKPLSGEEIYEAITQQKQRLEQYNKQLNEQMIQTTAQAQQVFSNEKANTHFTQKLDQQFNFQKDSSSFEAKAVQVQSGSFTQTQANAEPKVTTELLANSSS